MIRYHDNNQLTTINDIPIILLSFLSTAQYSLGPPGPSSTPSSISTTATAVKDASRDGSKWVLKPQREGGGNNLYGDELSRFLVENKGNPVLGGG